MERLGGNMERELEKDLIEIEGAIKEQAKRDNAFTMSVLQRCYKLVSELKEYKDLEEQKKLLKLPCKIGQKVYMLYHLCEDTAWEIEEHKIRLEDIENIGKTVFLTQEEAEAALLINKMSRKSEETFEWLTYRAKEYVDFLTRNAPKKDKAEWNYRFIAALKFLGDYSLEDEWKEFEEG